MNILNTILIQVKPDGTFDSASANWIIRGKVSGYDADVPVLGTVNTKPITDQIKTVIAAVVQQGPPAPPAS